MEPSLTVEAIFVLAVAAGVFIALYRGWASPDVIALTGAMACVLAGALDGEAMLAVFSNAGAITVGAMFIVTAALQRTGVISAIAARARAVAVERDWINLLGLMAGVMVLSAFVNNTPVVLMLIPVIISVAAEQGRAPSKFLIPLSYASIFGGATTIIGTSTNLLVNGVAVEQGLEPFNMFALFIPGMILGAAGIVYMMAIGHRLLPERRSPSADIGEPEAVSFATEVVVTERSAILGRPLSELAGEDVEILDLVRRGDSLSKAEREDTVLRAGDRILLRAPPGEAMHLRRSAHPRIESIEREAGDSERGNDLEARLAAAGVQTVYEDETVLRQGVIGPGSRYDGRSVGSLNLRRIYDVRIMGVRRQEQQIEDDFEDLRLEVGDTLLLDGPPDSLRTLFNRGDIVNLNQPVLQRRRREKAPLAVAAAAGFIAAAAFGLLPIAMAALAAAVAVMALGCVRPGEAYAAIDWRILFLIFGMLAIGRAMQDSGAAEMVVAAVAGQLAVFGPVAVLAVIYLVTSILTETVTNNAAAILLTPIAIGLAEQMGVDPRAFVVAVMFAASASFATPLGYQTNTLVYGAGNYRFADFARVGLPLNLIMWLLAVALIPVFFPL
mgnify:CR=1 FL=1